MPVVGLTLLFADLSSNGCSDSFHTNSSAGKIVWSFTNASSNTECQLSLSVPQGQYLMAHVHLRTKKMCTYEDLDHQIVSLRVSFSNDNVVSLMCKKGPYFSVVFSPKNQMFFKSWYSNAEFSIRFTASPRFLKNELEMTTLSSEYDQWHGTLTSPGYDGMTYTDYDINAYYNLTLPHSYDAIMISFQRLQIQPVRTRCKAFLKLSVLESTSGSFIQQWKRCSQMNLSAEVYHTHTLMFHYSTRTVVTLYLGFSMTYSFHRKGAVPHKLSSGLFDCSVDYYPTFHRHLACNLEQECEGGQDETSTCPLSKGCGGLSVASGRKCFLALVDEDANSKNMLSWEQFQEQCQVNGASLAVVQTQQELDDIRRLLTSGKLNDRCQHYSLGLVYGNMSVPKMYRQVWTGVGRSVLYNAVLTRDTIRFTGIVFNRHTIYQSAEVDVRGAIYMMYNTNSNRCGAVCETYLNATESVVGQTDISINPAAMTSDFSLTLQAVYGKCPIFMVCPKQHVTHIFLACDPLSQCDQPSRQTTCTVTNTERVMGPQGLGDLRTLWNQTLTMPLFACHKGAEETIPFTLVCDFRPDCKDHSDETFCRHPPCPEMTCRSGQCFAFTQHCDIVTHCLDQSDEANCEGFTEYEVQGYANVTNRTVIEMNGLGYFTVSQLNETDDPCPDTHYRCPGHLRYCLPVYTRCNGYYDCLDREDEQGCDDVTCPGFYRCRGSNVCVHVDHLCDGWPQCPQEDDEWMCGEPACPAGCTCYGLAFVCAQPLDAVLFTQLRYLDGSGTGMTTSNVTHNVYLVHLTLARCSITFVQDTDLPNLQYLDLSKNNVTDISMNVFLSYPNLKVLVLADNPLRALLADPTNLRHRSLRNLDLSFTALKTFSSKSLSFFLTLKSLNLSHTSIAIIDVDGFQRVPTLEQVDVSGSPVLSFPEDLFRGVSNLKAVYSQTYKLCCQQILPVNFDSHFCHAPQDEISNCEDLLRSGTYRVSLWMMSLLSITGNVFCLAFRVMVQRKSTSNAFNVFVSCLCLADLLMGVYVTVIGTADLLFRGTYLHVDESWMQSAACRAAGFLCMLSNEVSALTILFITLDRFVVLTFPFARFRFERRSALLACCVSWLFGCALAAVPLLPFTSHWNFYSQTGICVPLPITRRDFDGWNYSFGVMIIFNFVLFVLIAAGQAMIYWTVRKNSMTLGATTRKSRDTTIARRLITVALTDFLCWVPIGLCGLLASSGVPVSGEVNVAMAIFVLPLNSAFNPFLYTFNVIVEKRTQRKEEKIMAALKAEIGLNNEADK